MTPHESERSLLRKAHLQGEASVALVKFERMIPMLSSFASALAGKQVRVAPGATTFTDGTVIYVRVPRSLAEEPLHGLNCDERDPETMRYLCGACDRRDEVTSLLFHEISHVAFGSFDRIDPNSAELVGDKYGEQIVRLLSRSAIPDPRPDRVLARIDETAGRLLNVLEDVRVDAAMRTARPGLWASQYAMTGRAIEEFGATWEEGGLNVQAFVAPIIAALDDGLLEALHPYLVEVMRSPEIQGLIANAKNSGSDGGIAGLTLKYLDIMRGFGFFQEGNEDEDLEKESGESEEGEEGEKGEPGGATPSDDSDESESSDERGDGGNDADTPDTSGGPASEQPDRPDEGEPEGGGEDDASDVEGPEAGAAGGDAEGEPEGASDPDEDATPPGDSGGEPEGDGSPAPGESPGEGDGADGDAASEQEPAKGDLFGDATGEAGGDLLQRMTGHGGEGPGEEDWKEVIDEMVETLEYFDAPSAAIGRVTLEKGDVLGTASRAAVISETILGPSTLRMRKAFEENRRSSYDRNRKSGRVSARVLGRRAWGEDARLFHRKTVPGKRDYAVLIGVDVSGSTAKRLAGGDRRVLHLELEAAAAQAELCQRLGINFAVYAHSGTWGPGGEGLWLHEIKAFGAPWNTRAKEALASQSPRAQNFDGHTLEFYRKQLDRVQATDKILMYYSDGAMPAENYEEELALLKKELETCRRRGYVALAVGALTDEPKEHGMDTVRLDKIEDLAKVVDHLGKRIASL